MKQTRDQIGAKLRAPHGHLCESDMQDAYLSANIRANLKSPIKGKKIKYVKRPKVAF